MDKYGGVYCFAKKIDSLFTQPNNDKKCQPELVEGGAINL